MIPLSVLSLVLCMACDSGNSSSVASTPDIGAVTDAGASDAGSPDAGTADAGQAVERCTPKVLKDKDGDIATKFVLTMFHFNLQYVATDIPANLKKYEDAIIKIGFKPLLDVLDEHPSWTFSLEFQGYMLEQMAKNHPKVFEQFRAQAATCQVEFVSFHYSDQLFLAYGERDMAWSHALNEAVFDQYGLHPSGVVFTQEGQFGEGMMDFMASHDRTIALYPKNLLGYFTGGDKAYPLWERWGTLAVPVGTDFNLTTPASIAVNWKYFNDGELLTTGGFSPYFVDTGNYTIDKASIKAWVDEVAALEAQGYVVASVADYVETIRALGVAARPLPDPLDGAWQPGDTDNVHRWMGQRKADIERDYDVLRGNWAARTEMAAAETMIAAAKAAGKDVAAQEASFLAAARDLAFAEVSDSTGWTPSAQEVDYSLNHATLSREAAASIISGLKAAMGIGDVAIDTLAGEVKASEPRPAEPQSMDCPEDVKAWTVATTEYDHTVTCYDAAADRVEVRIAFSPTAVKMREMSLTIPADTTLVEYTPALLDHYGADKAVVSYPSSSFLQDVLWGPFANGLVGLGGGTWLVRHNEFVHLALGLQKSPGAILVQDQTAPKTGPFEWRFSLVTGDATAAYDWAKKINTHPLVYR